jgi:DNA-binding transcriptional regulator YdaS (Cro superfamily)
MMAPAGRRRRVRVSADDLAQYGSVAGRTVNIGRAARGLGASQNAVRRAIRQAEAAQSSTFYRRLSGRGDADVAEGASARGMLQAAYGRGPRGGAVNARAAAQDLGVSPGTVRRWAAGTQRPSPGHLKALRSAARRAVTTKRGRRAATADFRASVRGRRALRVGDKLGVSGTQGPRDYPRDRQVSVDIDPEQIEDMLRAYEEGGDRGLHDWMADFLDNNYVAGWEFLTIDDLGIGQPDE